jgi:hypothetical protein
MTVSQIKSGHAKTSINLSRFGRIAFFGAREFSHDQFAGQSRRGSGHYFKPLKGPNHVNVPS